MAEPIQIVYTHKELATVLVKERDIHEGLWAVFLKFGLKGGNVGATDSDLVPTALVGVLEIGLQRADKANSLTIDAAEVNPKTPAKRPAKKKKG